MAARRERERRRPSERRYQFAPPDEPTLAPEESLTDGAPLAEEVEPEADLTPPAQPAAAARGSVAVRTRASRGAPARPTPQPFSAYREEYRYVIGDLRRILVVMGSLLVVLVLLWLVLPR
jgi:hypothetical protein